MIVNPDKFQSILLDQRKSYHRNQGIVVNNKILAGFLCLSKDGFSKIYFFGVTSSREIFNLLRIYSQYSFQRNFTGIFFFQNG